MRRTPAAEDQSDSPTALIDRISAGNDTGFDAEYAIPAQRMGSGRHRRPGETSTSSTRSVTSAGYPTKALVPESAEHMVTMSTDAAATSAIPIRPARTGPVSELDSPDLDSPDLDSPGVDTALAAPDPADAPRTRSITTARPTRRGRRAAANRATVRRLAPLGVGAAVMLVSALVVAVIPQNDPAAAGPVLSSQLAQGTDTAVPDAPGADSAYPISPDPDAADLDAASPSAAAGPAAGPAAGRATSPAVSPAKAPVAVRPLPVVATKPPVATPPPTTRPVAPSGDGTQAATRYGWQLEASDEFNGTGLSGNWGAYDGAGQDGKGRRTPDAISVSGGVMTIKGDSHGTTGGMAWNDNQTYGRWEIRARFPKGDDQYHPVLLLWPDNGWPPEVDFSETTSASTDTSFFLHYSSSNEQVSASRKLDLTQWHDYAVEWEPGHVTGYVDGVQWFQSTDGKTVPDVPMHLAVQLDYFPDGGSPQPSELDVDYVRIYK